MRQLRVKSGLCYILFFHRNSSYHDHSESCGKQSSVQHLSQTCERDYSLFNEEQRSFLPGWLNQSTTTNYSPPIHSAFRYKSGKELDTYVYIGDHETYGSGGYVYEFRGRLSELQSNLSQLRQLGWIDEKTRAVIIQCTLYNPNAQLFTSVTLLVELLSTGGIIPTARFEPLSFQGKIFFCFFLVEFNPILFRFDVIISIDYFYSLYGIYCLLYDCRNSIFTSS
jgi:polycystin 1L2